MSSGYTYNHAHYVCLSSLHPFSTKFALEKHELQCLIHSPQQCVYPDADNAVALQSHSIQFPFFHFIWLQILSASSKMPTVRRFIAHLVFAYIAWVAISHIAHNRLPIPTEMSWSIFSNMFLRMQMLSTKFYLVTYPWSRWATRNDKSFNRLPHVTHADWHFRCLPIKRVITITWRESTCFPTVLDVMIDWLIDI